MNEPSPRPLRVGVIGHVEHVTLGRVPGVPQAGDIAHLEEPQWFPGGGGGITFYQLTRSASEVHLFTAIGNDEAGRQVAERLAETGAVIHAAHRDQAHTRDVVMIDDAGERTIVVVGEPLHPNLDDDLPWSILGDLDAVYFSAQDPRLLARARDARRLIVTARRREAIRGANVVFDAIVGSNADPRERSTRAEYAPAPLALVMTEGDKGGVVETQHDTARFTAPAVTGVQGGAYGAGDSFAGALVHFLACGKTALEAAQASSAFGAAVLNALSPLEAQARLPDPQ